MLSDTERQVLRLAATGLSAAEIADVLGCPRVCVQSTTASAMATLGATSKLAAIIIAYHRGELVGAI